MPRPLPSAPTRDPGSALARTTAARPSTPKTKVLLVRQPVKSVRPSDQPDRTPLRLAIGAMVVIGIVAAVWLMGHIGFRLGFAAAVHLPDLLNEPGGGLAGGVRMLIAVPRLIFRAGLDQPMALTLGFVLVAIPAAGLSAARPLVPGGPRPSTLMMAGAITGAIGAGLNAMALVWWCVSPLRTAFMAEMPLAMTAFDRWIGGVQLVAGVDALAMISASLWTVLAMRLPVPLWLRALCMSACSAALALMFAAMSMSLAVGALIEAPRTLIRLNAEPGGAGNTWTSPLLALGDTRHQFATLTVAGDSIVIELRNRPATITAAGSQSIASHIRAAAAHAAP